MIEHIDACRLNDFPGAAVIDVRSPSEFLYGHVPGAINLPIFDDNERAQVGTRYNQGGRDAGFLLGLEIVGAKLASFVKRIHALYTHKVPLILYCWRGGMRSNSMAWLFDKAGFNVYLINGGYKAYRAHIRESAPNRLQLRVIGGMTGSGKTEVLQHLTLSGEQVIDLEALANHKGSVFGHLGQQEQPSNEQFENNLWEVIRLMDPTRHVFIEDESRSIGKVSLPEPFYFKMQQSVMYLLDVSEEARVNRLINDYGNFSEDVLVETITKLDRFMGGDVCHKAIDALKRNDLHESIGIVLRYYDKKYMQSIEKHSSRTNGSSMEGREIIKVTCSDSNSQANATRIQQIIDSQLQANNETNIS